MNGREQFLENVMQLTVACPHDHSNPPYCPLHEVRKMSAAERAVWVAGLGEEEIAFLRTYHEVCLQWRESMETLAGQPGS